MTTELAFLAPTISLDDVDTSWLNDPDPIRAILPGPAPQRLAPQEESVPGDFDERVPSVWSEWLELSIPRRLTKPEQLTLAQLDDLSDRDFDAYNQRRNRWHANPGIIPTPQMTYIKDNLRDIVNTNHHTGEKVRGAIAIDGPPGHGKSTIVNSYLMDFQATELVKGARTPDGSERVPIIRISLKERSTDKEIGQKMCTFLGLPTNGSSKEIHDRLLRAVKACRTRIIFIDEIQFLSMEGASGRRMQNYFKFLANEFPVTLVFAGHGVRAANSMLEGGARDAAREQTESRWTYLDVAPFRIDTEENRLAWWELLLNLEDRLVLSDKYRGMLSEEFADYVFARTQGRIQSVFTLVNRAAGRAIYTGEERFSRALLDAVKIEAVVEKNREAHLHGLRAGMFESKPSQATRAAVAAARRAERERPARRSASLERRSA
ncbi:MULTISPECIES: ATP-binding protein [unclassified Frondihabitans]|uniref:ATP-binding protein n=1 Tax=unclassified Frondihabitans TaxID=2626248 RepID=UPI000F507F8A|nr:MULTISPECIES: ATP-binding protein [unclassified Frondihabitans]RPE77794.1 TniB protein [Frondihabitans sp. PhB153]RPF08073.1 TniB protein [Frondihabitans sp. PhB161]